MKKYYRYGILLLLLLTFGRFVIHKIGQHQKRVTQLKKEIFKRDSLINLQNGMYSKLVNNAYEQKELFQQIKDRNEELFKTIKELGEKPIQEIRVVSSPNPKTDTIYLQDTIIEGVAGVWFTDRYPSKEDWFIDYTGYVIGENAVLGHWNFQSLELDLTITETEAGLWKTYLDAPEWMSVSKLTVNALNMHEGTEFHLPRLNYLGGGGFGFGFDKEIYFMASFGIQVQKNIGLISINTDKDVELQYLRAF